MEQITPTACSEAKMSHPNHYGVMVKGDVPVDEFDPTLDFIQLSRTRVPAEINTMSAKFYGFCAIKALRGIDQSAWMSQ